MHWFHYVGKFLVRVLLVSLSRWRVEGKQNVPGQGPLLVVANHLSQTDPPIVSVSLGRKAIFMAKQELFRTWFPRYFVSNFGAFSVYRGRLDREALRQVKHWLGQGMAVVMFPEGKRSKTYRLQPGFPGSALVASHYGVPILPVGVTGTQNIRGAWWWLRRPRITVNFGKPFSLPAPEGALTKTELAKRTDFIMAHIAALLPSEYGGTASEKK